MTKLTTIEDFFKDYDYKDGVVKLDDCTKIIDLKKFVDSHISILKKNSGNRRFLPYYERLHKIYLITKI